VPLYFERYADAYQNYSRFRSTASRLAHQDFMNLTHILSELRTSLQQTEKVISALERLAPAGRKRRGRGPKAAALEQSARPKELKRKRRIAAKKAAK